MCANLSLLKCCELAVDLVMVGLVSYLQNKNLKKNYSSRKIKNMFQKTCFDLL